MVTFYKPKYLQEEWCNMRRLSVRCTVFQHTVEKRGLISPVHTCDSNATRARFEPIPGSDWSTSRITAKSHSNGECVNRAIHIFEVVLELFMWISGHFAAYYFVTLILNFRLNHEFSRWKQRTNIKFYFVFTNQRWKWLSYRETHTGLSVWLNRWDTSGIPHSQTTWMKHHSLEPRPNSMRFFPVAHTHILSVCR